MAIRITSLTIDVGVEQQLELAQGEDREFQLAFELNNAPVDMTGITAAIMTVRNRTTGQLVFARSYSGFVGSPSLGTLRFQILQADTANYLDGPYDYDVIWTDATGYLSQVLVESTLRLLRRLGEPEDVVTSPPATPVVYGLNHLGMWSTPTGGYSTNDSVIAQDGSLGGTSISSFRCVGTGVTYYPINASLLVATGWAYVAQHGGLGPTGPQASGAGGGGLVNSILFMGG